VKSYLDLQDEIAYYLRSEEYGTRRSDDLLITDPSNTEASRYWEGQLWVAVRMGGFAFCSRTLGPVSTGKVLRCWMSSIATAALIRSRMLSLP
jgi:hypothetical protein